VAGHDPAAGQQRPEVRRRRGLPGVRPELLQVVGEHGVGAQQRLDAHGGGDVGRRQQPAEVGQGQHQHPEHAVGAVDEGQPLLLGQLDRLDAALPQRLRRPAEHPRPVAYGALAHQRERHGRQRGQVPGAAQRAVLVHDRRDARVEHGGVGLRGLHAYAGAPGGQRGQPQEHQRAHDLALHLGPRSRRVRADQAALELGPPLRGDVRGGERAEAGGDPVVRPVVLGQLLHDVPGAGDLGQRLVGEPHAGAAPGDADDVLRGHRADPHDYLVGVHVFIAHRGQGRA
jgi:hypothetical protein